MAERVWIQYFYWVGSQLEGSWNAFLWVEGIIFLKMEWLYLVQWRSGGSKAEIGHSHRCFTFFCYFIKGYAWQDQIQVGAIVHKIQHILKETKLSAKQTFIKRDNAKWFSSQEISLFLFHLNAVSSGTKIKRWVLLKHNMDEAYWIHISCMWIL